jgi:hypothetical protein
VFVLSRPFQASQMFVGEANRLSQSKCLTVVESGLIRKLETRLKRLVGG